MNERSGIVIFLLGLGTVFTAMPFLAVSYIGVDMALYPDIIPGMGPAASLFIAATIVFASGRQGRKSSVHT